MSYQITIQLLVTHDGSWSVKPLFRARRQFDSYVENVGDLFGGLWMTIYNVSTYNYDLWINGFYSEGNGFDIDWFASEDHVEDSIRIVAVLNTGSTTIYVNGFPVTPGNSIVVTNDPYSNPWSASSQTVVVSP